MTVAILGANGQLGSDVSGVYRQRGHTVLDWTHDDIDINDEERARALLEQSKPDLLINTAAYHHVEKCEENPELAYRVNALGPCILARLSNEYGYKLAHISTDYVFGGDKGAAYVEGDEPVPLNVYGNTKLAGEHYVRSTAALHFVVRCSGIYGRAECRAKGGLSFVDLMLKLALERDEVRVVDTERLAPTHTLDIGKNLEKLTGTEHYGLYHMAAQDGCTWYAFASAIFELSGADVQLSVADPSEYAAKVPRPLNSTLENNNLRRLNLDAMPHWRESLDEYLTLSGIKA